VDVRLGPRHHRRNETPDALRALAASIDHEIRNGGLQPAVSGSLFQLVVAHCAASHPQYLGGRRLVMSEELQTLYGLGDVGIPIEMTNPDI
jgi:hypothetical protein